MGLMDTPDDSEEEESNDQSDSGTYIQFISGPDHRDWKDSWSDDAKDTISEAYETAAPSGSSGVVNQFANTRWDDRHHFYADMTNQLHSVFADNDFQPMLDFLMGDPESDETVEFYADQIVQYLEANPDVGEAVLEQANAEPAPADD